MIIDGTWLPFLAVGILTFVWAVVLWGSRYFGPQ
jgi:hypothetical protein